MDWFEPIRGLFSPVLEDGHELRTREPARDCAPAGRLTAVVHKCGFDTVRHRDLRHRRASAPRTLSVPKPSSQRNPGSTNDCQASTKSVPVAKVSPNRS